jgi:predicted GIY-YIG superfamily endonuclease
MCWPEMHEACLRLLDLHDGVSLTAEDREMVALQYIRLAKNPYYWDWTILKRIIAHYLVEPGFLCIAHEGTLRWVRDFDKWDMRVDAQLGVPGLKAALARAYETKATACQESVVESPIAGSCGEWPCVADIIGMAPIPCVVHDGQVAIYALMGHDARIYYIGQARNPVARYAAHVTKQQSSTAPLFGPRASLHPQMKVLRWVKEEDAFRVEREAINHYIALGEPLVNDNRLWRDGADVIEACLTTD